MPVSFDPAPAAALLAKAWRNGEPLSALPMAARPTTLAEGYAVQEAFVADLGERVVGWKLGGGSPVGKRQNGLTVPLIGQVVASRAVKSGDVVPKTSRRPLVGEFEIAFVLQQDVGPDALHSVPGLVSAHAAFELVQSRYVDRAGASVPETVADNAFAHAIVVGEALDLADLPAIIGDVIMRVDGVDMSRGLSGDDLVDPALGLAEFVAYARDRGLQLHRGDTILTGTLTRPFEVAEGAGNVTAVYLDNELRVRLKN